MSDKKRPEPMLAQKAVAPSDSVHSLAHEVASKSRDLVTKLTAISQSVDPSPGKAPVEGSSAGVIGVLCGAVCALEEAHAKVDEVCRKLGV